MTGKIKLNAASGGGSVSFQAPSSTGDDRVITLPTTADGTVLTTTNPKAGNIIQVVQHSTNSEVSSTNASYVDSGLSGAITPSASSNKILVIVNQFYRFTRSSTQTGGGFQLLRGSTVIETGPNNSSGSEPYGVYYVVGGASEIEVYGRYCLEYLDSPSTTSSTTYKTQMAPHTTASSATVRAQYQASGENATSYLTLMEVAA